MYVVILVTEKTLNPHQCSSKFVIAMFTRCVACVKSVFIWPNHKAASITVRWLRRGETGRSLGSSLFQLAGVYTVALYLTYLTNS